MGVAVRKAGVPSWLTECIRDIETSRGATVVAVLAADNLPANVPAKGRAMERLNRWLFDLYLTLDRRRFAREAAFAELSPVATVFPNCETIRLDGSADGIQKKLRPLTLDVILDPLGLLPSSDFAHLARYGIWRLRFGNRNAAALAATGFWEVAQNQPMTETYLTVSGLASAGESILDTLSAPTHAHSVTRSQTYIYAHIPAMLLDRLRAVAENGESALQSRGALGPAPARPYPSNLQMIGVLSRMAKRAFVNRCSSTFYQGRWALAFQWQELPIQPSQLHYITAPEHRSWADPFVVYRGGSYYVFHEEFSADRPKGSIVLTTLDADGRPQGTIPILNQEYHLSYPFVFEWDGAYFMVPETASARRVDLYRCVSFPSKWTFEKTLLSDVAAYDSTLAFIADRWWLFTSFRPPRPPGSIYELHLYHAVSPLGPWSPHPRNPVKRFNVISTRPAGSIFQENGIMYRPGQDCSRRYGYGVSINRILNISPERYDEVVETRILPDWDSDILGVHTLNKSGKMIMIDCLIRKLK